MPQRFLKPGFRTSKRLARCSRHARLLYVCIITLVDDFGRYDADPQLLRAECFPHDDDVRTADLKSWLKELSEQDAIVLYESESNPYLQVTRWIERTRAAKSKYPNPPNYEGAAQTRSTEGAGEVDGAGAGVTAWTHVCELLPESHRTDAMKASWSDFVRHRHEKRAKLTSKAVEKQAKQLSKWSHDEAVEAIEHSVAQGYTGIFRPSGNRGHGGPTHAKALQRNGTDYDAHVRQTSD